MLSMGFMIASSISVGIKYFSGVTCLEVTRVNGLLRIDGIGE
jgi:hypothetical protein